MDNKKVQSAILHAAAEFVNRESNRRSLITVTHVELDPRGTRARIFVSVFPDHSAPAALDFLSRMTDDLKAFVKEKIKIHNVPQFTFMQDPNIGGVTPIEEPPKA